MFAVRRVDDEIVETARTVVGPSVTAIDAIVSAVEEIAQGDETGIGIGVAGLVDPADGILVWGPHLSGTHLRIGSEVFDRLGLPVVVDNDANMALMAEMRLGVAVGYQNVLLVTIGTGIGGAIGIDGAVYRGGGFAGEFGHVRIEDGGLLCDCGKRGCWETRASGPALARLAREVVDANPDSSLTKALNGIPVTGESVVNAADGGDVTARALVTEVGRALGQGLANLAAIFDPDLIVVGGGLGSIGESIIGPARRVLTDSLHGSNMRVAPSVQVAMLGQAAGAIGAALVVEGEIHG